ncbi:hypothetical protein [Mucilaginibacter sp. PAMB04168]|uniref:hypothetical protein n=1 Tax=Mucilaginibacter sp. PAMB04168 TaxID=3138567 RepID=UPI0031F62058
MASLDQEPDTAPAKEQADQQKQDQFRGPVPVLRFPVQIKGYLLLPALQGLFQVRDHPVGSCRAGSLMSCLHLNGCWF